MGGFVWAVRSGLVWPPFDPGAAARYYDFMPYILHLPWKEEVLIDAPKRSVYQLSLWLSCHIPPRCRWSVPGPQYARTSPKSNSAKFGFTVYVGVRGHSEYSRGHGGRGPTCMAPRDGATPHIGVGASFRASELGTLRPVFRRFALPPLSWHLPH